jgi:glyoxylase-like metal-dependent hydrolase (beta-lactamase superfamily II)
MPEIKGFSMGHAFMYLVKDKRPILVDTGSYFNEQDYIAAFQKENTRPEDIALIVLTHGHWDHIAGVKILKKLTGAPVLCHVNAVEALKNGDTYDYNPRGEEGRKWFETFEPHTWQNVKDATADIIIHDDFDLEPYGVNGKIITTLGHSDSSISVVLESGEAVIGDFVMVSPYSGKLILCLIVSDVAQLKNSLKTLLNCAHTFYGGHGGPYMVSDLRKVLCENINDTDRFEPLNS